VHQVTTEGQVPTPALGEEMFDRLLAESHLCHPEDLVGLIARHAAPVGLLDPVLYLADLQQNYLVRVPAGRSPAGGPDPERLSVDGTAIGRVFRRLDVRTVSLRDGRHQIWLPLLDGAERFGVLGLTLDSEAWAAGAIWSDDASDEASDAAEAAADAESGDADVHPTLVRRAHRLASLVALLTIAKRAYSDTLVGLTRRSNMSLSAEIQWGLLPPLSFATDRVVLTGALEPAYQVAGDTFDYGIVDHQVHLALFDAAGHDLASAVVVGLAAAAYRRARRGGLDLVAMGDAIDLAVNARFGPPDLVTGVLARLDTQTGRVEWILRGHPPPVVVRDGKWVKTLRVRPGVPMGVGVSMEVDVGSLILEPGDRLILYTDGVTEARDREGNQFGLDRLVDFVIRRDADGLPAPETLRLLIRSILEHQEGQLQDDATVLVVEWKGAPTANGSHGDG
jgi:hypothetical protein